jgi:hypothetical protein
MIFLGDQKWTWYSGSARPAQRSFSHGDFLYQSGGQIHGLQNLSDGQAEFLVVELKGSSITPTKPASSKPASSKPAPPAKRRPSPRVK